jgi:anti-sigma B factor antagonist
MPFFGAAQQFIPPVTLNPAAGCFRFGAATFSSCGKSRTNVEITIYSRLFSTTITRPFMQIGKKTADGVLHVSISGKIDTLTAPALDKDLQEDCEAADSMVLDFTQVDYISSAGLRILLRLHKRMAPKGGMCIIHANETVKEVFSITGFIDLFSIE